MEKIVILHDFSECADNALKVAADVARKLESAEIHLYHIYEKPISGISLQFYVDKEKLSELKKDIQNKMDEIAGRDYLKDIKVHKHYVPDKEVWEVLELDSMKDVDLIVMGTHGVKGFKEYFIGSNTQKIVRLADCPVIAIKNPIEKFEVNDLVFASDFQKEVIPAFVKIKKLADLYNSKIHLLKVNTKFHFESTPEARKRMQEFAEEFNLENYTTNIYNDESIEDGIDNFCNEIDPDLISMETHGRIGVSHIMRQSITEHVVNHVNWPVLSVKMVY
ncbi:MAG: universal stress protein [Flavobacteriales bacterium]